MTHSSNQNANEYAIKELQELDALRSEVLFLKVEKINLEISNNLLRKNSKKAREIYSILEYISQIDIPHIDEEELPFSVHKRLVRWRHVLEHARIACEKSKIEVK